MVFALLDSKVHLIENSLQKIVAQLHLLDYNVAVYEFNIVCPVQGYFDNSLAFA